MEHFTGILVKSESGRGYTAIVAEYPGIIAEAETKEEARKILGKNLQLVLEYKRKQTLETYPDAEIESFALA